MYFEFDKENDMASYLSLSYPAMENVLQELDAIVKDEYPSLFLFKRWNLLQRNQ